ncbi:MULTISPECIES: DNA polymerase Y family protein [unclassified Mesorhizobium]|uniref:Y-family DNA polymerase n=1 Tax=unclassified Mesorhizobium TaxID=325217 RepID=UPI00112B1F44|nr:MULTISPECIES: DNA polymerase Y family protein [unclassified Mesorhizobium]MBZ9982447.1 DNA polymerase Y family protein [Mesorhizobium sp. BR-1-1-8]TPL32291.1 DNA polymerase Y family protein [Mesorhizobium sp. B2-4-8]TPL61129.1 DNA polymerase Y family protein [Mesorhizobium sp. B2-4-1]
MPRVVSLFFPAWPTDRLRRAMGQSAPSAESPIVMLGRQGNRRLVLAVDAAARAAGLRVGIPGSKAQVLVPSLQSFDFDAAGDAAALDRMALWSLRYAPIVAADPPDGLIIDTTGADHLHGGEEMMLEGLVSRMAASGIEARAAVADTWGAAHACARFLARPTFVAPVEGSSAIMLGLPIVALRLPHDIVHGLQTLGFERVGEVDAAPRASLSLRFGHELGRRLDQAMGRRSEPFEPVRSPDLIEVRRAFGEPIGAAETIARYAGKLVAALCEALETRGLGARRLDLLFHRVDNRIEAIRVGTAVPVRDVKRLTRLLTDRIETVDPGFGIELMTLTATLAEPFGAKQIISSLVEEPEPDITDLIDTLTNRIGEQRLYRFAPLESDVPERSIRRIAPTAPDDGTSWPGEWPRPPRLLTHPEPIETMALLPDHPPVWFSWRGIRRRVTRADGPERVFGEWWRRDAEVIAVRDYFQVEDEAGDRFWIYRAGDGEDPETGSHKWFLHGVFA